MRDLLLVSYIVIALAAVPNSAEDKLESSCAATPGDTSCKSTGTPAGPAHKEYHWPMQKGDAGRTGLSPHIVARNLSAGPTWKWTDPYGSVNRFTPLIDDELNVYLATISGRFYKFSPDGQELWMKRSTFGQATAVPALWGGKLIANSAKGYIFAWSMETGEEVWATQVSALGTNMDTACLLAIDGIIVSATLPDLDGGNLQIVAVTAVDGQILWRFNLTTAAYNFQASSPNDGTIIFQDKTGGVYRLQLHTGELIWSSGLPGRKSHFFSTGAAVVGGNGIVYAASNTDEGGLIHAYRLDNGEPVWQRKLPLYANQGVAVGKLADGEGLSVTAGVGSNPGFPLFLQLSSLGVFLFNSSIFFWWIRTCLYRRASDQWRLWRLLLRPLPLLPEIMVLLWFYRQRELRTTPTGVDKSVLEPFIFNGIKFALVLLLFLSIVFRRLKLDEPPPPVKRQLWLRPLQSCALGICATVFAAGFHVLCIQCNAKPAWLWNSWVLEAELVALDAETGKTRWSYKPPDFSLLACAGDEINLFQRIYNGEEAICLPDSWSQNTIGADGTVYAGFEDGNLYAVWDANSDGHIDSKTEVSKYDFGHGFQASHGLAPGLLAVVPCGGGLYVWRS